MNVLVIAPHPDDESIGCGGTIRLHTAARGNRVSVVFLTSGELGIKNTPPEQVWVLREAEAEAAASVLGISKLEFLRLPDWYLNESIDRAAAALRPVIDREQPERIYLPHPGEWHPDHRAVLSILREAFVRRSDLDRPLPQLLAYEVWTPLAQYDDGENITAVMADKLRAVRCYDSQVKLLRYDRGVRGLNQYRGAIAWGCRFAEVFHHVFLAENGRES